MTGCIIGSDDVPFALPPRELISHLLDLPFPPSINSMHGHGRGRTYRSSEYVRWIAAADELLMLDGGLRGRKTIDGRFYAQITLTEERWGKVDLDNCSTKAVLDYAQSRRLIANDRNAWEIQSAWGYAPTGCRLLLGELV